MLQWHSQIIDYNWWIFVSLRVKNHQAVFSPTFLWIIVHFHSDWYSSHRMSLLSFSVKSLTFWMTTRFLSCIVLTHVNIVIFRLISGCCTCFSAWINWKLVIAFSEVLLSIPMGFEPMSQCSSVKLLFSKVIDFPIRNEIGFLKVSKEYRMPSKGR